MTITTHNNDGTTTRYHFDPAHYEGVIGFYQESMENGDIQFYTVLV